MRVGAKLDRPREAEEPSQNFCRISEAASMCLGSLHSLCKEFWGFQPRLLIDTSFATRFHRGRNRVREGLWKGLTIVPRGAVKWFNPTKGYGFIQPQGGGKDVFVHISAVERAGLHSLNEGQPIEFEIAENRGRSSAENLRVSR